MEATRKEPSTNISEFPDQVVLKILKLLPVQERLLASEVCMRWHKLSRLPWLDVSEICLSSVEMKHLLAMVRQCPNASRVTAFGSTYDGLKVSRATAGQVFRMLGQRVASLCIYNPARNFTALGSFEEGMLPIHCFYNNPEECDDPICGQNLREFVWHNDIASQRILCHCFSPPLENRITRLQLSGGAYCLVWEELELAFPHLPLLESFIFACGIEFVQDEHEDENAAATSGSKMIEALAKLSRLKEMLLACWGVPQLISLPGCFAKAAAKSMAHLHTVCFGNYTIVNVEALNSMVSIPSLRMLLLAGCELACDDETLIIDRQSLKQRLGETQLFLFYATPTTCRGHLRSVRIQCHSSQVITIPIRIEEVMDLFNKPPNGLLLESWISKRITTNAQEHGVQFLDGHISDDEDDDGPEASSSAAQNTPDA